MNGSPADERANYDYVCGDSPKVLYLAPGWKQPALKLIGKANAETKLGVCDLPG